MSIKNNNNNNSKKIKADRIIYWIGSGLTVGNLPNVTYSIVEFGHIQRNYSTLI